MSSKLRWMPDWLTGPSLGQYMRVRPGGETLHSGTKRGEEKELSSTKQMLKKHMVDSFFERALHQIDPELTEEGPFEQEVQYGSYESNSEPLADDVVHEPIFEAEEPLDDSFLIVEEEAYDNTIVAEQPAVREEPAVVEPAPGPGYYIFAITLGHLDIKLPDLTVYAGNALFVFPFGNAQAIISEVPLDVYSEDALQSRLNDPAWFEQTLRTHTDVLSQIQSQVSIVPMRVCTICDTVNGLDAFLKEHHDDFVSTLQLIEGNHSWRFSIFCNEPRLRTLTAKASNRVRAIQGEMAAKSEDEVRQLHEKLHTVLEEEARSVCKACLKHSHGMLSSIASKNLIHSFTEEQAGDPQKREIFRCDYLVQLNSRPAFEKEFKTLLDSYKALGFEMEIDGPHAPSQFAGRKVLPAGDRTHGAPKSRPVAANMTGG